MYTVKFKQLFPESVWGEWRDADGRPMAFETYGEAVRCATELQADRKNMGYLFKAASKHCADPILIEKAFDFAFKS